MTSKFDREKNDKIDTALTAAVVLSSAYLLSPIHATLYVAGSGVMLYTGALPGMRSYIDRLAHRHLLHRLDTGGYVYKNLKALPATLQYCALLYVTTALFRQPLDKLLGEAVASNSDKRFIIFKILSTISCVNMYYNDNNENKLSGILVSHAVAAAVLCVTKFDQNYLKVFAPISLVMFLQAKFTTAKTKNERDTNIKTLGDHFSKIASETFIQLGSDLWGLNNMDPLVRLGAAHLQISLGKATEDFADKYVAKQSEIY